MSTGRSRESPPRGEGGGASEASVWSPLRQRVFRALWLANLASFIGTWVNEVAATWLMTSLAPTPLMVASVQVATTLPMFVLVLPAGALADVADRRRLLIGAQFWMMLVAGALAAFTWLGSVTPVTLLVLTGLLAVGAAVTLPAWQAILPEVVSEDDLPGAITLGSVSINVARAVGPALGGFVVAAAGPAAAFLLNGLSFAGVVFVLGGWRRQPEPHDLPAERFVGAIRTGLRYVRHAPRLRSVLVRTAAFTIAGSALWALLPLVARVELGLDAVGYGSLLAVFGASAVTGATQLSRLRRRLGADGVVVAASLAFAVALAGLALVRIPAWAFASMALAGAAWLLLLSIFQVAALTVLPAWVRARALGAYLLVFFGSLSLGSLVWGAVASAFGLGSALVLAALVAAGSVLLRWRYRLLGGEDLNLSPSRHWPVPGAGSHVACDQGPVLVTLEYHVDPADLGEFRQAMERLRRARQRDGAYFWDLFADTDEAGRYLEVYLADSWLEHLRQHERVTEEDRASESQARRFVTEGRPVSVQHFVSVSRPPERATPSDEAREPQA